MMKQIVYRTIENELGDMIAGATEDGVVFFGVAGSRRSGADIASRDQAV